MEVVRLLCRLAVSMPGMVLRSLAVSRAHPHCKVLRDNVYIEAPRELGLDPSKCLRLKRCLHGTRDAGQVFEFAVGDSKCTLSHKERSHGASTDTGHDDCGTLCGDDYMGLGAEVGLEWYRQHVSERFIMKLRELLGTCSTPQA